MKDILLMMSIFLLRLGAPLAITLVLAYALRRLDAKWQAEAVAQWVQKDAPAEAKLLIGKDPCWAKKGCTEAQRAECPACKLLDLPCWVARLRATGRLLTDCRTCELFALRPIKVA